MQESTVIIALLSFIAIPVALILLDWITDLFSFIFTAIKQAKMARLDKQTEFLTWQYSRSATNLVAYKQVRLNKALNA